MLYARAKRGTLPLVAEPREDATQKAALAAGQDVVVRGTRDVLGIRWLEIERVGGRRGWIQDGEGVELREEVLSQEREVSFVDSDTEALRVLKRGARLGLLAREEWRGRAVRVRLPSGREGFVPGTTRVAEVPTKYEMPVGLPRGFDVERWFLRRGVTGSLVLVAVAVLAFALTSGRGAAAYYPAVLLVVGVIGVVVAWRRKDFGLGSTAWERAPR